jgi:Protein of unknown function (DUF3800)
MRIFADESGAFGWGAPGISLMVALVIPDGALDALTSRFLSWKSSIVGKSTRELKGSELDSQQLRFFVQQVLPSSERAPLLTVVGADTTVTQECHVSAAKHQLAAQYAHTARLLLERNPPNRSLGQNYTEVSGWTKKRSAVNFLWIVTAERAIAEAVQLMICAFLEREYDQEFENIEIAIDRSFIKEPGPINFWLEYHRLSHLNRAKKGQAILIPREWRLRNHPYHRKYRVEPGISNLSDLLRNHMNFVDSKQSFGVQIADICAQICRRFHAGDLNLEAYELLQRRVIGREGIKLLLVHFDQTSVFRDSPENYVNLRTTQEQIRQIRNAAAGAPNE